MSHTNPTSTLSNFQLIFDNALKVYKKRTRKDLLTHPLADRLKACDLPSSILSVLREQVQELNSSRRNKEKWLDPVVSVLHAFSDTLGEDVGGVLSPAKVIFIGFSVLFSTATAVRADHDTLFLMFERIEAFFRRLDIYTEVTPNQGMVDTITVIMVEVLNFIGIAIKEMKQCRTTKYLKRLMGKNDSEDALKRLDSLTQELAQMATQILSVTNTIDNGVWGIGDNMLVIDNRLASIDDWVAGVDESVASVDDKVEAGDDKLAAVNDDGNESMEVIQQAADGVDQMERDQMREDLRGWLSPQDPFTNHNIACNAHHKGTATWFLKGEMYNEWKSTGSLLWIHGKPGSGKSILCSTIIEDVQTMYRADQASVAFFYFDFQDINKQHLRDLVPSLLIQLSVQSDPRCDILSRLHSNLDSGARQPNDDILTRCLKEMLALPDQRPIYLILDALDECSNVSGIPSPRDSVLRLVKELVNLQIPNLHICVTCRPEIDIRRVLMPLTSRIVSLHDESGQKQDIEDYVRSVVYSERHMRRWRVQDKEFAIETLSERAEGVFRWIFCQLEVLRHCLPPSVRPTLKELPKSLDMTYERILKEIKKSNMLIAQRVLHCLVAAVRPPRVEELAEVLAVDFDDAEGIPRLKPDWRWEDQEQALLSACSSLIAIVEAGHSRVVKFSHFSVKEFLTSPRLATASGKVSNYHLDLGPAHVILAQACLGVLLQIQDNDEWSTLDDYPYPYARYAAEHWTTHAQFGEVSSRLRKGMEYLFDAGKPHFGVWLRLCNIDNIPNRDATFYMFTPYDESPAAPLYYAALCGFHDLVEHLITKYPQHVNADGGYYVRPLVAALAGEHFQTADLLRHNGADLDVQGENGRNPLHAAAYSGNLGVVQKLIEFDPAHINARDRFGSTPLLLASEGRFLNHGSVLRLLLDHGADINVQDQRGWTPLQLASIRGVLEVVRLLLEHGADVEVRNDDGRTALQEAADRGHGKVVDLLREHGAR